MSHAQRDAQLIDLALAQPVLRPIVQLPAVVGVRS